MKVSKKQCKPKSNLKCAAVSAKLSNGFKAILYCLMLFFSFMAYGQDPPQYGEPFNNVPDPRDVNMYQVNIRAFSAGSDLPGVTARLDNIKDVGTNVIYLMPIYPVGEDSRSKIASSTSPYSIKDFKAVGSEYGTLADLRTLVDGAHARGMAVILDFVVNQTAWDHPWITQHPDWYIRNGSGEIQQLAEFTDVAALDFSSSGMRSAMIDAMRYWVFAANIDGFRMDFANHPPLDFWTQANNNLRSISSHDLLMFAEGDRIENFNVGFDLNFGDKWYYDALININDGASVSLIQSTTNTEYTYANGSQQMVRYTGNHDTSGTGTPIEVFGNTQGVMANFVVSAYMKGVPFLYGGQEVAFPTRIPWPWDGVDINWNGNASVTAEFKKVLDFRTSSTAIRRGTLSNFSNSNVCAFTKTSGQEEVLVLINLKNYSASISLPGNVTSSSWNDAYNGNPVSLGSTVSLNAFEYRVYIKGSGSPSNQAPSANAGANQNLQAGTTSASLNGSGSDPDNDALSYNWSQLSGPTAGIANGNSANTSVNGLTNGSTYVFRLTVSDGQLSATDDVQVSIGSANPTQSPYGGTAQIIPGTIEVENFDNGGEGTAYHDIDGSNNGGQYRPSESVDIESCTEGGYNVGWTASGEWMEYTVNVTSGGTYTADARVASAEGGNFRVEIDGVDKTGAMNVPNTGGWQNWQTISSGQFTLSGGTHIMRIYLNSGGYNINSISISSECTPTAITPYTQVNGGSWQQGVSSATVNVGQSVAFGPQPLSGGSWGWSGPNGYSASVREVILSNLQVSQSGNYEATYTNASGCTSTQVFMLTVNTSGGGNLYRIKNRWLNAYLYDDGDQAKYGSVTDDRSKWELENVEGYTLFKNKSTGDYLNIENQYDYVESSNAETDYWSAQWSLEDYDDYVRIRNRWKNDRYIHLEQQLGYAQCTAGLYSGSYSNHWTLESVGSSGARMGVQENETVISTHGIKVFPVPATDRLNIKIAPNKKDHHTSLVIFDNNGKKMLSTEYIQPGIYEINIEYFKPGLFTLLFNDGDTIKTIRVIKK